MSPEIIFIVFFWALPGMASFLLCDAMLYGFRRPTGHELLCAAVIGGFMGLTAVAAMIWVLIHTAYEKLRD